MRKIASQWVPSAAVQVQERGPENIAAVDDAAWSEGHGFHRGFFSAFRIRKGRDVWFHFPLPTQVESEGRQVYLQSVSLIWEAIDNAEIGWSTLQHGGFERIELTPRLENPSYTKIASEVPEAARKFYPEMNRLLSRFALEQPLPLQFGVQLCVMIRAPEQDGTIRFYGAGGDFAVDD